ncbi:MULTISPECIES: hypothetical protein [unclassified Corynebacterium]|uniref:hypothetical protein n=1 Tax=unclassified Corynebacterium TaxID=2624378 RepID=UPI0029CA13F1|nr:MULTISPECIES: hypothetical protein [unclassified Corynebacterium]WPF65345.1 hypothetical protein OLX12_07085 [Corynebacterium sp. 22KM0430]WPF67840.1 hypothetical protein OLW90_07075 [Corynebacterium sp. 21KM1197]
MTRFLLSTALPTGLISAALLGWSLLLLGEAPNPLAVHFSGSSPDGFASPWTLWSCSLALVIVILGFFCRAASRGLAYGAAARVHAASMAFGCFLVSGTVLTLLRLEPGTPLTAAPILILLGGAVAGGTLIALIARPISPRVDSPVIPGALEIPTGGATAWIGTASLPLPLLLLLGLAAATLLLCGVLFEPWLLPAGLLVFLLTLSTAAWQVRADSRGLALRSLLGWPRLNIAIDEIEHAEVANLNPADWGGWGWRISSRGRALMLRGGTGLRVRLRTGKVIEVSCTDTEHAEYAAAVLNSYAAAPVGAATRTPQPRRD